MKPNDRQSGFTVIELLAVVVIISMVAAFSLRGGGFSFGHSVLDSSANDVVYALRFGRLLAIEKQIYVRVKISSDDGKIVLLQSVMNDESSEVELVAVQDRSVAHLQLQEDVALLSISQMSQEESGNDDTFDFANEIIFSPNGLCKGVMITLGEGENKSYIKIAAATGKVSVTRSEGNAVNDKLFEVVDLEAI